jgi:response regulator RpfG family c-di-GMP phosphodiesterase
MPHKGLFILMDTSHEHERPECRPHQQSHDTLEDHAPERKWTIIIADDEEEVHAMTRLVLSDYEFDGLGLEFVSAYSGAETLQMMQAHPDTAMILLDVVMESDDAGLAVVRAIRREMNNPFVRIVLRTGQPGKAPETQVIASYDINDYKEKTELTAQKLYTTITSSLRTYRDMRIIEQNRRGLEMIIEASADLFEIQSLRKFAHGVLMQLVSILQLDNSSAIFLGSAFTASRTDSQFEIIAGTGKYHDCIGQPVQGTVSDDVWRHLTRAIEERRSFFEEDKYTGFFASSTGHAHLMYLRGCRRLTSLDKYLITIFCANVSTAFKNISLNNEIIDTQKEMIFTLGEVIESRSQETGNHVRRVAEFSHLLALKAGLGDEQASLLRLAAPMHDVGKVGIPDAILLKQARLNFEEYEKIKYHTEIGHQILKNSRREILEAAVVVASQHHERWDGKGYPRGLKGDQIHIFGRITALADVMDALLHRRVYKPAWHPDKVLEYIREKRGTQFDPHLANILLANSAAFIALNEKYPDHAPG